MSSESEQLIALTSRELGGELAPLSDAEVWTILGLAERRRAPLAELVGEGDPELPVELREKASRRLEFDWAATELVGQYFEAGIWSLTPIDEAWPESLSTNLGKRAPTVLWGAGEKSLLGTQGIGIVGSRNLTPEGEEVARTAGEVAARARLPVVSGAARGADRIGMEGAMAIGGQAVGALAHPLVRTSREASVAQRIGEANLCLISQFKPTAGFSVGAAMGRNKLIYALSKVTLVVATDLETGGTWAGAMEAIRLKAGRVAVWRGPGEGPGSAALAEAGATPISDLEDLNADLEPGGQLDLLGGSSG